MLLVHQIAHEWLQHPIEIGDRYASTEVAHADDGLITGALPSVELTKSGYSIIHHTTNTHGAHRNVFWRTSFRLAVSPAARDWHRSLHDAVSLRSNDDGWIRPSRQRRRWLLRASQRSMNMHRNASMSRSKGKTLRVSVALKNFMAQMFGSVAAISGTPVGC